MPARHHTAVRAGLRSDCRTGVNRRGPACTTLDTGRRRANLRLTVSMGSQDLQYVVLERTSHASPAAPSPRRPPSAPLGLSYPASLAAGRWVHPSQPPSHSFCDALLSRKPDRGPSWTKGVGPGRKAACESRYHFARRSRTRGLDTRAERGRISTWSRKYPTGLQASCGGGSGAATWLHGSAFDINSMPVTQNGKSVCRTRITSPSDVSTFYSR